VRTRTTNRLDDRPPAEDDLAHPAEEVLSGRLVQLLDDILAGRAPNAGRFCGYCYHPAPAGREICPNCGRAASEWPAAEAEAPVSLQVGADGTLRVPASASRYDRFQVARVSNWLPAEGDDYVYRLAPASLARAAKQGIKVSHIIASLQKATGGEDLPPTLVGALHRWERAGGEAALKDTVVLKLSNPALLETLQRTPKVKRYLGESLGPDAVEVRRDDIEKLRAALAEVGILVD